MCTKKLRTPTLTAVIFPLLILAGCSAFQSTKVGGSKSPNIKERSGIAYFLPKGKLHIVAIKNEMLVTNEMDLRESSVVTGIKSNGYSVTQTITVPTPSPVPSLKTNTISSLSVKTNGAGVTITSDLQITNIVEASAGPRSSEPQLIENRTWMTNKVTTISYKPSVATITVYNVTVTEEYEKDGSQLFLLDPKYIATASDSFRVNVGPNGLLTSIASTNRDETGQVLVELAKAAAEAYKLSVGGIGDATLFMEQPKKTYPDRIDIVFDPFDPSARIDAKAALDSGDLTLDLTAFETAAGNNPYPNWDSFEGTAEGVFYRPSLPYEVKIKAKNQFISKTVYFPNKAPILAYDIRRASFVTTTTQLGFSNGCLVEVYSDKPSEALAVAKIPAQVLQTFVSLPTNILQLKFDIKSATQRYESLATNDTALRVAELESQLRLFEAQQRITNALAVAPTNDLLGQIAAIEAQIRLIDAQQRLLDAQRRAETNSVTN